MLYKPSLKDTLIKAFISAVADIGADLRCPRHEIIAMMSECDDVIPLGLCKRLGVPDGCTYSDAAIAAALRDAQKFRRWWW
jgi:hypothetical protein